MDTIAKQNNQFSRLTKKLLKNMGISDISKEEGIDFSSIKLDFMAYYELEKVILEIKPYLRHPEGEFFLYDIPMSKRLLHILANYKVFYLSRLSNYTHQEILQFRNLGTKTLKELENVCKEYHITLPE